ncbi:MAG: glycosyltransferase family 4 protein [Anaerolineales bacterium]|nr:glycosyltransferase family 4 protein [Anaerolineales bacterium]
MMTRRPRTALIHYSAPPVVGGVEAVLRRHAGLLVDHGYQAQVIAGRGQAWDGRIPLEVVPLLDSRHAEILAAKRLLDEGRVPGDFDHLIARIRQALAPLLSECDVLLAHNVGSLHKNLALTAALEAMKREGQLARLVLWHHDLAWTAARYRRELYPGWPWSLLSTDWGAEHVAISEFRRRQLADLMGIETDRIAVIPNGVDAGSLLKLSADARQIADRLNLAQADPILLIPVRLTRRKNIELALRAGAILRESFPRLALLVTGPPGPHNPANQSYFDELRELRAALGLEEHVHFLAENRAQPLTDEVVGDLFRLADALLLPSREEGFGIPLLEAALARIPVFCTDIAPLRELGGDQASYFAVDAAPREVAGLLASSLKASPTHAMAVRVRQSYDWNQIFIRYIEPMVQR